MDTLHQQYEFIKSSRKAMFHFCEGMPQEHLSKELKAFANSSIRKLLVHTANVYFFWLNKFGMDKPFTQYRYENFDTIEQIASLYAEVDAVADSFLTLFYHKNSHKIAGSVPRGGEGVLEVSVLQLFTHVVTHEFHHKGQVLWMGRQLGHIPPDTDVIR